MLKIPCRENTARILDPLKPTMKEMNPMFQPLMSALLITTFVPKGRCFATFKKEKGKFIFNVFKETYLIYLVVSEELNFPFHLGMTLINFYPMIFFARRAKGVNGREGGDGAAKFHLLSF